MFSGGIDKQHGALMGKFQMNAQQKNYTFGMQRNILSRDLKSLSADGLVPDPVLVLIALHHKIFALIFSLTDQVRVKLVLESREI